MQISAHNPINIENLTINYGNKECISTQFNTIINYGKRIAIIGRNGCGKSSLLNYIAHAKLEKMDSAINIPHNTVIAYVPQIITTHSSLSGGQRFNKELSLALSKHPNLLLLDEPTNHLDQSNRKSLLNLLKRYSGTLIVVSHDVELIENNIDTIWHIHNNKINVFNGSYSEYLRVHQQSQLNLIQQKNSLKSEINKSHQQLMQEQQRAKTSRNQGEKHIKQRKWPTVVSTAKALRAEKTSGKNKKEIMDKKESITQAYQNIYIPETITPKFNLHGLILNQNKQIVSVTEASCGYNNINLITNINLNIHATEKIALIGNNGSGKSTLMKALLGDPQIYLNGSWQTPKIENIGHIDQHYLNLNCELTAYEHIKIHAPQLNNAEIRNHLNLFLLRKNEEVNIKSKYLSGGEKARLSLAIIAINPPQLLLLDEITNNIDIETKNHMIQVLAKFPASIIIICHEEDFLKQLNIDKYYTVANGLINFSG